MHVINEQFYKIVGLDDEWFNYFANKRPRRLWLRRLALLENAYSYYKFAVSAVLLFQECSKKSTNRSIDNSLRTDLENRSHASALAFYTHSRVCIKSIRSLTEEAVFSSADEEKVTLLQKHRDKYSSRIKNIIDKRNDICAHPHDARKMIINPSSWGTDGTLIFSTIDLEHLTKKDEKYKLVPVEDLKEVRKYIAETVVHLKSIYNLK